MQIQLGFYSSNQTIYPLLLAHYITKNKGEWSCQDIFADENKAEAKIFASLMADKHAQKKAKHAQHMLELEIKKQWTDLEATQKCLEAEGH